MCVQGHYDYVPQPTILPNGQGGITIGPITLVPIWSCDKYEEQCIVDERLPGECPAK